MLIEYLPQILIGLGTLFTVYVINNTRLKEGLTEWFLDLFNTNKYNTSNHNVKDTIIDLKFKAKHTAFKNSLKTELYHYYANETLTAMDKLVDDILEAEKKMKLNDLKSFIKQNMYNKLSEVNDTIDNRVVMPDPLQDKFDYFKNYLTQQYTYAIDNSLKVTNKKMMVMKVLDSLETNSNWFLFFTDEMFENFNGHFDKIERKDVFKY